jgi:hypothetical protein
VAQTDHALASVRHLPGEGQRGVTAFRADGQSGALPQGQDRSVIVKSKVVRGDERRFGHPILHSVRFA